MGEYEDLNDLVRDGSKKLRESKTLPDEEMLRYNRPRQFLNLHGSGHVSSVGGTHGTNNMIPFSPNSTHFNHANTLSPYGGDATMSGTSSNGTGGTGSDGRVRKRVFSAEKGRAIYHKVLGSTPKIKSNPRDTRTSSSSNGNGGGSSSNGRGRNSSSTNNAAGGAYHPHAYGCLGGSPLAASDANKNKTSLSQQQQSSSNQQGQQQQQQQSTYSPNYFPTQCNFFPNNNDWTEVLGFSVNSLWNCGANGDLTPTMSPHSNPSSPTHNGAGSPTNQFSSQQQQSQSQHGQAGGGYSNGPPQSQYPQGPPAGYHIHQGYNSSAANGGTGGYAGSSAYNNATPSQYNSRQSNDEGRNPSYGYGRGGSSACVRDTVVM